MKDYSREEENLDGTFRQKPEFNKKELSQTGISAVQGETDAQQDWVDQGIMDVKVADLPNPEGVSGPEDFNHHISYEDAVRACEQLPEVQQEVNSGKTGEDYTTEDEAAGLSYPEGKRRVYDLFYSESDPIKLDKDGDTYDIVSGRHRIYVAKAVGLESVPARVVEKEEL